MVLGLGTGSTARYVIEEVGQRIREGKLLGITAVPTSVETEVLAREEGIPLVDLGPSGVDLAIDGMDEITPELNAIKGLGGALAREKVVASSARAFILVGDASKRVTRLGSTVPVPVEILPFGWQRTLSLLEQIGTTPTLRTLQDSPITTDNGNWVVDCRFPTQSEPQVLAREIRVQPGVVEHGFFIDIANLAYIGEDGQVSIIKSAT
jgi:ribose 5-phosphate isomerase A